MKKNNHHYIGRVKISIILSLLCLVSTAIAFGRCKQIVIKAEVVAYESSALRTAYLPNIGRKEIFYLKVDHIKRGKEDSEYIKVEYIYRDEKNALPENFLEGSKLWKFLLIRNKKCDQVGIVKEPPISIIKIDEDEELPQTTNIPCYTLEKEKLETAEN